MKSKIFLKLVLIGTFALFSFACENLPIEDPVETGKEPSAKPTLDPNTKIDEIDGTKCDDTNHCTKEDIWEKGVCVGQYLVCNNPPQNVCVGKSTLRVFKSAGVCGGGECIYDFSELECEFGCDSQSRQCEFDRCLGVVCNNPPNNFCLDAKTVQTHQPAGRCVNGGCIYDKMQKECAIQCDESICIDDPCFQKTCKTPPAAHCKDEKTLIAFSNEGRCSAGECAYDVVETICPDKCQYGQCISDPCAGKTCTVPPAQYCKEDGQTLVIFAKQGSCENGECSYFSAEFECPYKCANGQCVWDPCLGKVCEDPPARYCEKEETETTSKYLVLFQPKGTCSEGICEYEKRRKHCQEGCAKGKCNPQKDPCANQNCGPGQKCFHGVCRDNPCNNFDCGEMRVCAKDGITVHVFQPECKPNVDWTHVGCVYTDFPASPIEQECNEKQICENGECVVPSESPKPGGTQVGEAKKECVTVKTGGETSCKPDWLWKSYAIEDCKTKGMLMKKLGMEKPCDDDGAEPLEQSFRYAEYICCPPGMEPQEPGAPQKAQP